MDKAQKKKQAASNPVIIIIIIMRVNEGRESSTSTLNGGLRDKSSEMFVGKSPEE